MRRYTTKDLWVARIAHARAAIGALAKAFQAVWRGIRHPEFRSLIRSVGRVAWPLCIFIGVPLLLPFLDINLGPPAASAPSSPLSAVGAIYEFIYPFVLVLAATAVIGVGVARWMLMSGDTAESEQTSV